MRDRPPRFSLMARARSFRYALRGARTVLFTQHNAWIHLSATIGVVAAGAALRINRYDWCWIIVATVAVWTAEALNTALEFLCDYTCTEQHPTIGNAKDVAAAAVLISAIGAALIGVLIFTPYVAPLFR